MNYDNQMYEWQNEGTEPSADLKNNGFQAGQKPAASVFNHFWALMTKAIKELQTKFGSHADNKSNPHGVTAAQIGAATSNHTHTAEEVGAAAATHTHAATDLTDTIPVDKGGTGATSASAARGKLGVYSTDEVDLKLSDLEGTIVTGYCDNLQSQVDSLDNRVTNAEDQISMLENDKAPAYTYGTADIEAGSASSAATGTLHFVYE